MNEDTFVVITPFGTINVDFPEDGGTTMEGPQDAIDHFRHVLKQCVGTHGYSLTPDNLEPVDLENLTPPADSLLQVVPPLV